MQVNFPTDFQIIIRTTEKDQEFFSNKIIPATQFSSDLSASWLTRDQNRTGNVRVT